MSTVKLTAENFAAETARGIILVDFWAEYCGPCRMMAPILEKIASEHSEFKIGKVDTAAEGALAARFDVSAIPTLIVYKDGREAGRNVGAIPEESVLELIKSCN